MTAAEHAAEQRARPNRLIESAVRPETASRIVLLCPKELAAQTGLSYRTILNHIRLGHLPARRLGPKLWQINQHGLKDWLLGTDRRLAASPPFTKKCAGRKRPAA